MVRHGHPKSIWSLYLSWPDQNGDEKINEKMNCQFIDLPPQVKNTPRIRSLFVGSSNIQFPFEYPIK